MNFVLKKEAQVGFCAQGRLAQTIELAGDGSCSISSRKSLDVTVEIDAQLAGLLMKWYSAPDAV